MPDPDQRRLIEVAFRLKQASLDPVYEKNVRHGTETCCVLVSFSTQGSALRMVSAESLVSPESRTYGVPGIPSPSLSNRSSDPYWRLVVGLPCRDRPSCTPQTTGGRLYSRRRIVQCYR
jgi:hypothetical protein